MIEVTFLGTSSMQPTKSRNQSAILLQYKGEGILFDCGEGTQRQLRLAGVKPSKITKICLSHWHGDHVFGLPGLLSTIGVEKNEGRVLITGPNGSSKYVEHLRQSFAGKEVADYLVKEVREGIFFENEDYLLEAEPLKHSTPCIGFSFREKDRLKIDLIKAKNAGLKEGPLLGKLQRGEDVMLNGKKVKAKDITFVVKGKKISYIADTLPCEGADALARDADLLISEGTHLDDIKEKTEKYMHLTVKQAALIASANNAKRLIITHLSQRYKAPSEVLAEAKEYFPGAMVAEDFMKVKV